MSSHARRARALYDYTRTHTDELTFKKGDVLSVIQHLDGGWWEGSLNGVVGWFPSNYVTCEDGDEKVGPNSGQHRSHLYEFQQEIVQHILEGEIRQINELSQLINSSIALLEPFTSLPFLTKLSHMKQILLQAVVMHQTLAAGLDRMKNSGEIKRVGALFLDVASTINAIGCDYSKVHLYIVTGLDKNTDAIERHFSSGTTNFQIPRCKQQLSLLFDRLGRYPLLLKEMERYLENPHVDREDILKAMNIYGEITERCAILRKFKEYDIEILLSTIIGWQGKPIDQLGDPILTLRVMLTAMEPTIPPSTINDNRRPMANHPLPSIHAGGQLSVLVIFPACILLLSCTKQTNTFEFLVKLPLNCLEVVGCVESETDLDVIVTPSTVGGISIPACRLSISCTDQNARDLLVSTLTDLIHYQTQLIDQQQTDTSMRSQQDHSECAKQTVITRSPSTATRSPQAVESGSVVVQPPVQSTCLMSTSTVTTTTSASETTSASSPSSLAIHFLPHRITTHAHVRFFDADKKENYEPLPIGALRCLRLDGPTNIHNPNLLHSGSPALVPTLSDKMTQHHHQASSGPRPHSPKNEGIKDLRRKKSDRQKSAVNTEEVLRSVGKLHDQELRTADAARELQVVEAYCASAWNQLGCQSLSTGHLQDRDLNRVGGLSPAESTALLQTISTPSCSDASPLHVMKTVSGSGTSISAVRQAIPKRNPSRGAYDAIHVENPTPTKQEHGLYGSSLSAESVQNISPPPVILPSRSGRRV